MSVGPRRTGSTAPRGVRVLAPAKLNLLLRVLAREVNGFHSIESLFVKLALHDQVTMHVDTARRTLRCHGPRLPDHGLGAPEENLAWRAAAGFAEATGWPTGWDITIEKHIPVGGGLGGGSADAAAVLRGLNAIAPAPLEAAALLALAGTLGSDVPFLVSDALLAWAWGRGDRLLTLPALPAAAVTLLTFREGVNTGAAYAALSAQREGQPAAPALCYPPDAFASWAQVAALATNDFEAVVPALHADVGAGLAFVRRSAAEAGRSGPAIGLLSGSGATCFALAPHGPPVRDLSPDATGAPPSGPSPDEVPLVRPGASSLLHTETAQAIVAPEPIF